jgi:HEPN domain-containing protein
VKEKTKQWVEFAERDLEGAKALLKEAHLANLVLFHSQQAVEKIFKAVLEDNDLDVPRIHNIEVAEHIYNQMLRFLK